MLSLRARLLFAASIVLLIFIGLCGAGLEKAFRSSAFDAQLGRMQGLVYALLGAAEQADNSLTVRLDALPEPRLQRPQSGLEAAVLDDTGKVLWRSPSAGARLPLVVGADIGRWRFERLESPDLFTLAFGLRWIGDDEQPRRYTVLVLESPHAYDAQLATFRRTLWLWLLGAAAGLLAALLVIQRWGLTPLRRLAAELRGVESGRLARIEAAYPPELEPLTGALNAMIRNERSQQTRYRNALGDLAHSLKTPLAVLRGLDPAHLPDGTRRQLDEQLGRMQQIVDYQLARAAAAGRRTLAERISVRPIADKLVSALTKVYADKRLRFELEVPPELQGRADGGDLYEVVGNVLDNAAKWARGAVRMRARREGDALLLELDDDGPGFPDDASRLLDRGVRADSRVPGQGLGLSAAAEIVRAYEGEIVLSRSNDLGGARVTVRLPV